MRHDMLHTRQPVVSRQAWEAARAQLLAKEKAQTRARDALAAERRRMPWLAVEKAYAFDGPQGKASLLDLFGGRRQLIVYRAFFEPGVFGWPDQACRGCSMVADQVAHLAHLNARDTTLVFVSRAPQPDIARLTTRMGWTIPWYSLTDTFDADFGVDEWHGTNAFIRDGDSVFRTYFINSRGDEAMGSTWSYLDMTALGRQEPWEDSPDGFPQTPAYKWWNWHDSYVADAAPDKAWVAVSDAERRRSVTTTMRAGGRDSMGEVRIAAPRRDANDRDGGVAPSHWSGLVAAPVFATMALLTAAHDAGPAEFLCAAMRGVASPLGGMVPKYLLMSAVHCGPWVRLIHATLLVHRSVIGPSGDASEA